MRILYLIYVKLTFYFIDLNLYFDEYIFHETILLLEKRFKLNKHFS